MINEETQIFPANRSWSDVYEYTHNYMAARYGRQPAVEDAASDGFTFTLDKWAKAPSTKLGEWDPSMAFAFAVRISCLKARKALGSHLYSDTVSLEEVLSEDGFADDHTLLLAADDIEDTLIAEEQNAQMATIIEWCLNNPRQRRWMEEFLSGENGAAIARKSEGDTRHKAHYRKRTGLANIRTIFQDEISALR